MSKSYDDYVAEREFVTECPHGRIDPDLCGICYVTNMGIERARKRQTKAELLEGTTT